MRRKRLGWEHSRARAAMPEPAGEPCPYCRRPMWRGQRLDADHPVPRVLGDAPVPLRWAHARCNRSAGARLGNALRGGFRERWIDQWG